MPNLVYATATCWASETVFLTEGEPWDAADPFVRSHPGLFTNAPSNVRRSVVEQATAAPGESREVAGPDLDALRAQAEALGVKADKRWGAEKLQEAIEAAGD